MLGVTDDKGEIQRLDMLQQPAVQGGDGCRGLGASCCILQCCLILKHGPQRRWLWLRDGHEQELLGLCELASAPLAGVRS